MRLLFSIVFLFVAGGMATSAGATEPVSSMERGPERLVLPFSCAIEGGDVSLTPGPERAYPIIEARQFRPFTTCNPPFSNNCRTMMVHKFETVCGNERVAWVTLAAAMRRSKVGRVWLEKGHLNMTRKAENPLGSARSCSDKFASGSGTGGECLPWRVSREVERLVLPEGFAPSAEFGARFIAGAEPGTAGAAVTLAKADGAAEPDEAVMRPHEFTVVREPLPDVTAAIKSGPPLDLDNNWVTVVEARDLNEHNPSGLASMSAAGGMLAGLLALSAAGWFGWQRREAMTAAWLAFSPQITAVQLRGTASALIERVLRRFEHNESTGASYDPMLANAAESVSQMLQHSERAVFNLTMAAPLRDVLQQELASIRQRLAVAKASALDGNGSVVKLVAQFRALNRELDRVQRIAESASHTLAHTRHNVAMPKSKAEAYDVLGVNADVSENILKRLVDALRLTWHPDYAKDEADRLLREARIKQINIAWDIINGKRHAA